MITAPIKLVTEADVPPRTWITLMIGLLLCGPAFAQRHRAVAPQTPQPSTSQLLEEAIARGEISSEDALKYEVFAMFDDPRFPEKYRGVDTADDFARYDRSDLMMELASRWTGLSSATQETLRPFRLPAFVDQSWYGLKSKSMTAATSRAASTPCSISPGQWSVYDVVVDGNTKAKVWTDKAEYQQMAKTVAGQLQQKWNTVKDLFGQEPLPDPGGICYGPDSALDVVIIKPPEVKNDKGEVTAHSYGYWATAIEEQCLGHSSAYIQFTPDEPINYAYLTHELGHAFFLSYSLSACMLSEDNLWWLEAAASYAAVKSFPENHSYHAAAKRYQESAYRPIWESENINGEKNYARAYGLYLLPEYVDRKYGRSDFIKLVTQSMSGSTAKDALDNAIYLATGKTFDRFWPEFAAAVSNRPPFDYFKQWESLQSTARLATDETISGLNGLREFELVRTVRPMSMRFYDFKFQGDEARGIQFWNGYHFKLSKDLTYWSGESVQNARYKIDVVPIDSTRDLQVTAMLKAEGQDAKLVPWMADGAVMLCRDRRDERLEELMLIVTSTEYRNKDRQLEPTELTPRLQLSDVGCYKYRGTTTRVEGFSSGGMDTRKATVEFVADLPSFRKTDGVTGIRFNVSSGAIDWTTHERSADCVIDGSNPAVPINPDNGTFLQLPNFLLPGNVYSRSYYGQGNTTATVESTMKCPPPTGSSSNSRRLGEWVDFPIQWMHCPTCPIKYVGGSAIVAGDWLWEDPDDAGHAIEYTWNLRPVRE